MAVASRNKTSKEELTLDNGEVLHVTLIRGGFKVDDQEAFAEAIQQAPYQAKRAEKQLSKLEESLNEAIEQNLEEKVFNDRLEAIKVHNKKQEEFLRTVDLGILVSISAWDMALTEEDETARQFVPITEEGLKTLHPLLRVDIFTKVMDKLRGRSEQEKKGSSVSSNGGSPTQKESKEASPDSGPDTKSQCVTASVPAALEDGTSTSLTKPS